MGTGSALQIKELGSSVTKKVRNTPTAARQQIPLPDNKLRFQTTDSAARQKILLLATRQPSNGYRCQAADSAASQLKTTNLAAAWTTNRQQISLPDN